MNIIIISIILVILISIIGFLLHHLLFIKKQVKNIALQLNEINEKKINKKVFISLINKEIEGLALAINNTLQEKNLCEVSKIKLQKHSSEMISNISHDLRTPLTSILGYIQFMKLDNINDHERREYLNITEKRAKALQELLNDFYELSLIDSLDFEIKLEKVNITSVLSEVLMGKYTDFINRELEPDISIPKQNLYIIGEKKSLERIIENLLSNLIKYAKDRATISLGVNEKKVELKISNNVANMTKEDVEKIFDRFYMADKTRKGKGTGLGLSVAKGLVEKIHGEIRAEMEGEFLSISVFFINVN